MYIYDEYRHIYKSHSIFNLRQHAPFAGRHSSVMFDFLPTVRGAPFAGRHGVSASQFILFFVSFEVSSLILRVPDLSRRTLIFAVQVVWRLKERFAKLSGAQDAVAPPSFMAVAVGVLRVLQTPIRQLLRGHHEPRRAGGSRSREGHCRRAAASSGPAVRPCRGRMDAYNWHFLS